MKFIFRVIEKFQETTVSSTSLLVFPSNRDSTAGRDILKIGEHAAPVSSCHANQHPTTAHSCFPEDERENEMYIANQQEIFENASLEGFASVFSGRICDAVRMVSFSTNGKTYSKASVATVFPPWGGPFNCLLSLDICESKVETLATVGVQENL